VDEDKFFPAAIQDDPQMYWEQKGGKTTPVVDFAVYTKNRCFRIPGSSKFKAFKANLEFPGEEFFMQTQVVGTEDAKVDIDIIQDQPSLSHAEKPGGTTF
jgi:hypothetical protein